MSNFPIDTVSKTVLETDNDIKTDISINECVDDEIVNKTITTSENNLNKLLNPIESSIFKEPSQRRIIYQPEVYKQDICKTSSTRSIWCLDTEYQSAMSLQNSMNKLNDANYKKRNDYVELFEIIKDNLKKNQDINISELLKNPNKYRKLVERDSDISGGKAMYYDEIVELGKDDYRLGSPITISMQVKNAFSKSAGKIYLSPQADNIRKIVHNAWDESSKEYQKGYEYEAAKEDLVIQDYWKTIGIESNIERFDNKEDFEKAADKLPTHIITMVTFFGVVDILKSVQNIELKSDIKDLVREEKIVHDKRLKEIAFKIKEGKKMTSNIKQHTSGSRLKWILTLNGIKYKVKLEFIDMTALHGLTSLNDLLINCGIDNGYKTSLDKYKSCMMEALLYEPKLYHEYALGDIRLYEALSSYNKNLHGIYKNLGVGEYFDETSLTIGATANKINEAKICQKLGYDAEYVKNFTEKSKQQFCQNHTLIGSPQYLQKYDPYNKNNHHLFNGNTYSYNKILLAKADGGRAHCYIPLHTLFSKDNALCDIDLSGAYTAKMSNQYFYIGHPVIDVKPITKQLTLREHLKKYKKELGTDNYYMRVSGMLNYEQDIIPSFMDMEQGMKNYKIKIDLGDGESEILNHLKHDLECTKNKILTMEIEDGAITPDIVDLILNELSPRHRDDLLDNIKVKAFIYYPPSMEIKDVKELKEKLDAHYIGEYDGQYQKYKEWQDNEILNPYHHYIKVPYGEFIIDVLRTYRAKYKMQKKESLNQMFKLIGNTIYGINVSKFFPMSNVIFANNITAGVRCCIWYSEKALNFIQTITDGGIFDLNKVPHPIYERFDTTRFIRAYQSTTRELDHKETYILKPISRNKKPITFNEEKQQWLVDDKYYDESGFKEIIAELALEHIQKILL